MEESCDKKWSFYVTNFLNWGKQAKSIHPFSSLSKNKNMRVHLVSSSKNVADGARSFAFPAQLQLGNSSSSFI